MGPVECAFVVGSITTCYAWKKWSDRGSGEAANPKRQGAKPRTSQSSGKGAAVGDPFLERGSDLDDDDLEHERSSSPAAGAQLSRVGPRWVDLRVPLPITAEEYLVGLRENSHRVYKEESEHLVIKEHVLQDVCNSFKIFHTMPMKKLPRFLRPMVPELEAKSQIRLNFPQTQSYTRILKPKSLSEFFHYTEAWIVEDITDTPLFELAPNPSDSHEVLHLDVCKDGWKKYKAEHDPALHKFGGIGPLGEGWQKTKVKCVVHKRIGVEPTFDGWIGDKIVGAIFEHTQKDLMTTARDVIRTVSEQGKSDLSRLNSGKQAPAIKEWPPVEYSIPNRAEGRKKATDFVHKWQSQFMSSRSDTPQC